MSLKFLIRCNATGEERLNVSKDLWWHDASLYWFQEGNYSCDCNREAEFRRAGGESDDSIWEGSKPLLCGHERFDILWVEEENGTRHEIDNEIRRT